MSAIEQGYYPHNKGNMSDSSKFLSGAFSSCQPG